MCVLSHVTPSPTFTHWTRPTFPTNNPPGTATLPAPDGLRLKAVTVGRGTQNYTCQTSPTAAPASNGASALLLDTITLLPFVPDRMQPTILAQLPAYALAFSRAQLEASGMRKDGVHYFDGSGSPTFDLAGTGLGTFVARKTANIGAPKGATPGPNGAVDWLDLGPKDPAAAKKVSRVYRVQTASGMPPKTCEGLGKEVNIEYAALYYFYGPQ